MIIVVEGPDFAGKSTLVKRLSKLHQDNDVNVEIYHTRQPPISIIPLFITYVEDIKMAIKSSHVGTTVIFDRLHVGEVIYGPIYRDRSQIDDRQLEVIDRLLDDAGAIKVYVDTPNNVLAERFRGTRGEDLVTDMNTLLRISNRYNDYIGGGTNSLRDWVRWGENQDRLLGLVE